MRRLLAKAGSTATSSSPPCPTTSTAGTPLTWSAPPLTGLPSALRRRSCPPRCVTSSCRRAGRRGSRGCPGPLASSTTLTVIGVAGGPCAAAPGASLRRGRACRRRRCRDGGRAGRRRRRRSPADAERRDRPSAPSAAAAAPCQKRHDAASQRIVCDMPAPSAPHTAPCVRTLSFDSHRHGSPPSRPAKPGPFVKHRGTGFAGPLVLPPEGVGGLHGVSPTWGEPTSSALKRMRCGLAPSSPRRFFLSASYSW